MSYAVLPTIQSEIESITWVPYAGIKKSLRSLGPYELEKAWHVGYHTLRTLVGCRNPIEWPTVRMWQGFETALANYLFAALAEIHARNLPPNIQYELLTAFVEDGPKILSGKVVIDLDLLRCSTRELQKNEFLPPWFGWRPLHRSHRLALQTGDLTGIQWPWERRIDNGSVRAHVLQAG